VRWRLNQTCLYWAPNGADNFGKPAYTAVVQLICRIESMVSETIDAQGNIVLSSATAYLATPVVTGGAMMAGQMQDLGSGFPANPKDDLRVHEILSIGSVPSLKNTQTLYTAKLR
jgi:hypothetical protein